MDKLEEEFNLWRNSKDKQIFTSKNENKYKNILSQLHLV